MLEENAAGISWYKHREKSTAFSQKKIREKVHGLRSNKHYPFRQKDTSKFDGISKSKHFYFKKCFPQNSRTQINT